MNDWFSIIGKIKALPGDALGALQDNGFVVIPGPLNDREQALLAAAYDSVVESANPDEVAIGRTTTRLNDFVNRGEEFDELYVYEPVLEACMQIIGQPFKLSTLLARTLRPQTPVQTLHVDFARDATGYPMVGFILMIDEFRSDNGATRFVRGSHRWSELPENSYESCPTADNQPVGVSGAAGSMIIYNGSVWHGHGANLTDKPRRSIQGAFIRREAPSGEDLPARMKAETLTRISPLAKYLLNI